jgi:hypothetical protein
VELVAWLGGVGLVINLLIAAIVQVAPLLRPYICTPSEDRAWEWVG